MHSHISEHVKVPSWLPNILGPGIGATIGFVSLIGLFDADLRAAAISALLAVILGPLFASCSFEFKYGRTR
jgi:hypothetical protein